MYTHDIHNHINKITFTHKSILYAACKWVCTHLRANSTWSALFTWYSCVCQCTHACICSVSERGMCVCVCVCVCVYVHFWWTVNAYIHTYIHTHTHMQLMHYIHSFLCVNIRISPVIAARKMSSLVATVVGQCWLSRDTRKKALEASSWLATNLDWVIFRIFGKIDSGCENLLTGSFWWLRHRDFGSCCAASK